MQDVGPNVLVHFIACGIASRAASIQLHMVFRTQLVWSSTSKEEASSLAGSGIVADTVVDVDDTQQPMVVVDDVLAPPVLVAADTGEFDAFAAINAIFGDDGPEPPEAQPKAEAKAKPAAKRKAKAKASTSVAHDGSSGDAPKAKAKASTTVTSDGSSGAPKAKAKATAKAKASATVTSGGSGGDLPKAKAKGGGGPKAKATAKSKAATKAKAKPKAKSKQGGHVADGNNDLGDGDDSGDVSASAADSSGALVPVAKAAPKAFVGHSPELAFNRTRLFV
jgi:hypothetical protein